MTDYAMLCRELSALTDEIPYQIANLSNAAALLWQHLPDINWAKKKCLIKCLLYGILYKPKE